MTAFHLSDCLFGVLGLTLSCLPFIKDVALDVLWAELDTLERFRLSSTNYGGMRQTLYVAFPVQPGPSCSNTC